MFELLTKKGLIESYYSLLNDLYLVIFNQFTVVFVLATHSHLAITCLKLIMTTTLQLINQSKREDTFQSA